LSFQYLILPNLQVALFDCPLVDIFHNQSFYKHTCRHKIFHNITDLLKDQVIFIHIAFLSDMFPYNARLLRCHPYWSQLRSPVSDRDIHIRSHRRLHWMCCECDAIFESCVMNLTRTSCRCKYHSGILQTCKRPRYAGSVPMQLTRPIRAGLLESINSNDLVNLIVSFIENDNQHDAHTLACTYISEMATHTRHQLLDGGFWWDDTSQRKNGTRYRHSIPPSRKRPSSCHTTDASSTLPIGGDSRHPRAATMGDPIHTQISTPAMEDNVP
jgi:hypothetical protein